MIGGFNQNYMKKYFVFFMITLIYFIVFVFVLLLSILLLRFSKVPKLIKRLGEITDDCENFIFKNGDLPKYD